MARGIPVRLPDRLHAAMASTGAMPTFRRWKSRSTRRCCARCSSSARPPARRSTARRCSKLNAHSPPRGAGAERSLAERVRWGAVAAAAAAGIGGAVLLGALRPGPVTVPHGRSSRSDERRRPFGGPGSPRPASRRHRSVRWSAGGGDCGPGRGALGGPCAAAPGSCRAFTGSACRRAGGTAGRGPVVLASGARSAGCLIGGAPSSLCW